MRTRCRPHVAHTHARTAGSEEGRVLRHRRATKRLPRHTTVKGMQVVCRACRCPTAVHTCMPRVALARCEQVVHTRPVPAAHVRVVPLNPIAHSARHRHPHCDRTRGRRPIRRSEGRTQGEGLSRPRSRRCEGELREPNAAHAAPRRPRVRHLSCRCCRPCVRHRHSLRSVVHHVEVHVPRLRVHNKVCLCHINRRQTHWLCVRRSTPVVEEVHRLHVPCTQRTPLPDRHWRNDRWC